MAASKKVISLEDFLKKLELKFKGKKNFEVISKYTHNKESILVKDKYGICEMSPNYLMQRSHPSIKTAVNKTEYCINKFIEIWGDRFDYSKFNYTGARDKSIIICKIHGEFLQDANMHISGRCGCQKCGRIVRGLKTRSCTEEFISKSKLLHGDKYDYSKVEYSTALSKVEIGCKIDNHNNFIQSPIDHLNGHGCPTCGLILGGFSRTDFIKISKNRKCTLYVISCYLEEELFYKIGITSKTVKKRFSKINSMPYEYHIVESIHGDAGFIIN